MFVFFFGVKKRFQKSATITIKLNSELIKQATIYNGFFLILAVGVKTKIAIFEFYSISTVHNYLVIFLTFNAVKK